MSVITILGLLCICFDSLCDWSWKLEPSYQPIRSKMNTNRGLVTAFSRAFYSTEFSSANDVIPCFDWLWRQHWFLFFDSHFITVL